MTKAAELAKMGEVLTNSQIGGRRNIIINGAMQVAQRSTSETNVFDASQYETLDRFKINGSTSGRATMTQTADGPSGFANCLKLACTTADTSISAGEFAIIRYLIEGQDLQQIKKGTSDAEKVTISFYVKGNANATYQLEFKDGDNNRVNAQTFNVTTSWNRIILTFNADTTGAFDDDNAASVQLNFWLHAGSTYTSGTFTSNTWASNTDANRVNSSNTSFFDSTDRTFFLTGLQMEVGSQATPFEHRSFGEEVLLCQRYYQEMGSFPIVIIGSNNCQGTVASRVPMRAAPTVSTDGNTGRITDCNAADFTTGGLNPAVTANAYLQSSIGWLSGRFQGFGFTGGTSGDPGVYLPVGTNAKPLQMDAEL